MQPARMASIAGGRPLLGSDLQELADLDAYGHEAFLRHSRAIVEFRANDGKVGGQFEGAPLVLVHHQHWDSGKIYVEAEEAGTIYVFATLGGGFPCPTRQSMNRLLVTPRRERSCYRFSQLADRSALESPLSRRDGCAPRPPT